MPSYSIPPPWITSINPSIHSNLSILAMICEYRRCVSNLFSEDAGQGSPYGVRSVDVGNTVGEDLRRDTFCRKLFYWGLSFPHPLLVQATQVNPLPTLIAVDSRELSQGLPSLQNCPVWTAAAKLNCLLGPAKRGTYFRLQP